MKRRLCIQLGKEKTFSEKDIPLVTEGRERGRNTTEGYRVDRQELWERDPFLDVCYVGKIVHKIGEESGRLKSGCVGSPEVVQGSGDAPTRR